MSQLPPFRTRRNEPVLNLDDEDEAVAPYDDNVPVLTQVVDTPPPSASATPSHARPSHAQPQASGPAPLSSSAIDAIVEDVMAELVPEIEGVVRQAILRHLG